MPILTSEWPDLYGNLMCDWGEEYEIYQPVARQLVKYQQTTKKTGKMTDRSMLDIAPDKPEGSPFPQEDAQQNYAIQWEQAAIGTSIDLTHEMFLYDSTDEMSDEMRKLARSGHMRIEHDISMRYRYGNAETFSNVSNSVVNIRCADTKALIADDHPIPNSSDVNDNDLDTLPFNRANLITALNRFRQFKNPKGKKITGLRPTHIVTSDDEEVADLVQRTIKSPQQSNSANNDINPLSTRGLQHIQLPFLQADGANAFDTTGRYFWFVVCQAQVDMHLKMAEEPYVQFPRELTPQGMLGQDPNLPITGDHKVAMRGTYALATRRPVFVVGSFATTLG